VNNGDGTFTERAHEYGLDITDACVQAVFADYDRDGYLDCYIVTNILDFSKSPQGRPGYLLHNNGNGTFTNVSAQAASGADPGAHRDLGRCQPRRLARPVRGERLERRTASILTKATEPSWM